SHPRLLQSFRLPSTLEPSRFSFGGYVVSHLSEDGSTVFLPREHGVVAFDTLTGEPCSAPIAPAAAPRSPGFMYDRPSSNGRAYASVRGGKVIVTETRTGLQLPVPLA